MLVTVTMVIKILRCISSELQHYRGHQLQLIGCKIIYIKTMIEINNYVNGTSLIYGDKLDHLL